VFPFQFLSPFKDGLQKWLEQNNYGGEIDKYVQDILSKSISPSNQNSHLTENFAVFEQEERKQENVTSSPGISPFETHDHVYVRIFIPDESYLSNLKIFHTTNQLIIEGLPSLDHKHVVTLPCIVKMKGATSDYRDDFLQIKLVKKTDLQFTEIDVHS
jgi:HSP20 family molecular chaperone IbpA